MKIKIFLMLLISLALSGCVFSNQPKTGDVGLEPIDNQTDNSATNEPTTNNKNLLNLSGRQLKKIPDEIFKQTNLEGLNASDNQLTGAVQAEIRQLQSLKLLDLSNNQLTGVPAEIGQLKNLETLDLSNNQLTGLPYELGNLKNLKVLNISGNDYAEQDLKIITEKLPSSVKIIK